MVMMALLPALCFLVQQATVETINVTELANTVMERTYGARTAIAAGDLAAARADVEEGRRLAAKARAALQASRKPLVVPLSEEVESTSTLGPFKRGKRIDRDASIREVEVEHRSVTLDVGVAEAKLEAARAALERGEPAAADAHLVALARSVEEHSVTRDPPRIKARQNLLLARTRVEQGRYKDAEAPLRQAARALGRRDIEDYAKRIRREPAEALERIDAWLREVTAAP